MWIHPNSPHPSVLYIDFYWLYNLNYMWFRLKWIIFNRLRASHLIWLLKIFHPYDNRMIVNIMFIQTTHIMVVHMDWDRNTPRMVCFWHFLLLFPPSTQFASVEVVVTTIHDHFGAQMKKYFQRKEFSIAIICLVSFICGLPCVFQVLTTSIEDCLFGGSLYDTV